jgi:signal transduction histidine kinase
VGFIIFALTILNDVLYANNILSIGLLTPLGLSIFIFSQSFLLSTKFSKAFSDSETYGKELEVLSENLEEKVRERTLELQNEKKIAEDLQNQAEAALMILKTTQSQLIEAERMASLGQLVGGVAHEINNPIGVIRSNSELISSNILLTIRNFPLFFQSLTKSEQLLFQNILEQSLLNKEFLSSKEERQRKKEIKQELEEILTNSRENIDFIAEQILLLKLKSPFKTWIVGMGESKFLESLSVAQIFINQSNSIGNIEIAVEKASRVVFALRSYLNTEMYLQRKEVDLILEIEKSLHLYDNYILGKMVILKEFPNELPFICIPENLSQVWKNIIFNAVQAMYLTEKRLEIKVQIMKEIPESTTKMNSSLNKEFVNNTDTEKLDWVLVSFRDSGEGISEDQQDRLFSPFFTTKAVGEGIGLGLYVSKKIVHEHGGIIFFESKKGATDFTVALPFK